MQSDAMDEDDRLPTGPSKGREAPRQAVLPNTARSTPALTKSLGNGQSSSMDVDMDVSSAANIESDKAEGTIVKVANLIEGTTAEDVEVKLIVHPFSFTVL